MLDLIKSGAVVPINKPLNWTSFQMLNKFRYLASRYLDVKKIKVGHAGTLDPLATGVVVLCTGNKTKIIETIQHQSKEYLATICLGATTLSFDKETPIDKVYSYDHISENDVLTCLNKFIGEIDQIPPIFSAVKVNGKRSYDMARQGITLDLKSKKIHVYSIELLNFNLPNITIKVNCGKGTYIRSLARDIGISLNSGGYLTALQRTRVGEYTLENSISIHEIPEWLKNNVIK